MSYFTPTSRWWRYTSITMWLSTSIYPQMIFIWSKNILKFSNDSYLTSLYNYLPKTFLILFPLKIFQEWRLYYLRSITFILCLGSSNRSSGLYSGDVTKSIWKLSFPSHSKICANEAPSKTIGGMNIEYICNWGVLALICFMHYLQSTSIMALIIY